MRLFKKVSYVLLFTTLIANTYQSVNAQKKHTFKTPTSIEIKPAFFQEWYAGIEVGGTGINVFIPVLNDSKKITLDSIYFRNLTGKLVRGKNKYVAILKNKSPYYTFKKPIKPKDYPFDLNDDECIVSYTEKGETKYFKIRKLSEVAGTYYEEGPPSVYEKTGSTTYASTDEEDDE